MERLVDNPHTVNGKKGSICPHDTCHLHLNKYGKGKLVRSWKAFPDLKIYKGTLKPKNATQKSGRK